jgi:hypothetical protein
VPSLTEVQDRFRGQKVTFIAIHTGEPDAEALAKRIQEYADEQGWQFLQAIDVGTMSENSRTSCAYGVHGFPNEVVVNREGVVVFNSDIPPAGMEDIVGKSCDEITPEEEARFEAFMKQRFEAAGVAWSDDDSRTEELIERTNRVHAYFLTQEIEKALQAGN